MSGDQLIMRCNINASNPDAKRIGKRVRDLHDASGCLVGRAAVYSWMELKGRAGEVDGLTAVGGFRASSLEGVAGVFLGQPLTADRSQALPLADGAQLANWATAQAELMLADWEEDDDPEGLMDGASVIYACGGETSKLPICMSEHGWLDAEELTAWIQKKREVLLVDTQFIHDSHRFIDEFKLLDNVLVVKEWGQPVSLQQVGLWPNS